MTPLVAKDIWSVDIDWPEYTPANPYDEFQCFYVTVVVAGDEAGSDFQVYVTTPAAFSRLKDHTKQPRAIVVNEFTPERVVQAIEKTVAEASRLTWQDGIDRLRKIMYWEYEGMGG